ncbi:unnamed protein product [Arabidopsis thaliana]|uniref:Uncharacterized protein n=1 Tax=Arabidopsis thaliana TaxID=3702 RepID=A0A654ERH5_ARATH|nr:unnamed protein product [Arabidopsis thaliana]
MYRYLKKTKSQSHGTNEDVEIDDVVRIDDEQCETSKQGEVNGVRIQSEEPEANDGVSFKEDDSCVDTLDPANWGRIDQILWDFLVGKGPLARPHEDYMFPKYVNGRHFSHKLYKRAMKNVVWRGKGYYSIGKYMIQGLEQCYNKALPT